MPHSQTYFQLLHSLQLIGCCGCQLVDRFLCQASELQLLRGVAHGTGTIAHNLVSVPRHRIHALCALCQGLHK